MRVQLAQAAAEPRLGIAYLQPRFRVGRRIMRPVMAGAGGEHRLSGRKMSINRGALDAGLFSDRDDAAAARSERGVKRDRGLDDALAGFVLPLGAPLQAVGSDHGKPLQLCDVYNLL